MYRLLLGVALGSLVLVSACGGDSESDDSNATKAPEGGAATATAAPAKQTPAELGKSIFAVAQDSIQQVTKLTESHPAAASVKPKVAEIKEAAVQKLVVLGRQVEGLSTSDRAQVDAAVSSAYNTAANSDWYKAYAKTTTLYTSEDPELDKQLRSFNIITQYAFFDLLKKQEPAEAQRLGIK